jgi:hypothetical protein
MTGLRLSKAGRSDGRVKDDFICPTPMRWNDIYTALLEVWRKGGSKPDDKPPVPLILAAWWECPPVAKKARWLETLDWADNTTAAT